MGDKNDEFNPRSNLAAAAILNKGSNAVAAAATLISIAEKSGCSFRLTAGELLVKRTPVPSTAKDADLDVLTLMVPNPGTERVVAELDFSHIAGRVESVRRQLLALGYLKEKSRRTVYVASVALTLTILFGMGLGLWGQLNPMWCVIAIAVIIGCTAIAAAADDEKATQVGNDLSTDWQHTASLATWCGNSDLSAIVACGDLDRLKLKDKPPWLEHPDDMSPTDAFRAVVIMLIKAYR